jgi:hypothetical protein
MYYFILHCNIYNIEIRIFYMQRRYYGITRESRTSSQEESSITKQRLVNMFSRQPKQAYTSTIP